MTDVEKKKLLGKAEKFFRETIAIQHIENLKKLKKLDQFDVNPFLVTYLAYFLTGNGDPKSLAKALVYPRILGTSITTSFGSSFQRKFISEVLGAVGTIITGTDIEFVDQIDHRKKYCQLKSGPNNINFDDVETIKNKFRGIRNLAKQNNKKLSVDDLIVGVLYGTKDSLSVFYHKIAEDYPVLVGEDFWYHLTGDKSFYTELGERFGKVARETDAKDLLEEVINDLAKDIEENFVRKELGKK